MTHTQAPDKDTTEARPDVAPTERKTYFIKAMQEGLHAAMTEDDNVVVIGEDVDRSIIGATRGLIADFGDMRVRNTPISERPSSAPVWAPRPSACGRWWT
jgi:hypothetical protein